MFLYLYRLVIWGLFYFMTEIKPVTDITSKCITYAKEVSEKVLPKIEEEAKVITNSLVNDAKATLSKLTVEKKIECFEKQPSLHNATTNEITNVYCRKIYEIAENTGKNIAANASQFFRYPEQEAILEGLFRGKTRNIHVINLGIGDAQEITTQAAIAHNAGILPHLTTTAVDIRPPEAINATYSLGMRRKGELTGHARANSLEELKQISGAKDDDINKFVDCYGKNIANNTEYRDFWKIEAILSKVEKMTKSDPVKIRLKKAIDFASNGEKDLEELNKCIETLPDETLRLIALENLKVENGPERFQPLRRLSKYYEYDTNGVSAVASEAKFPNAVKEHTEKAIKDGHLGTPLEDFASQQIGAGTTADAVRINNTLQYLGLGNPPYKFENPLLDKSPNVKDPKYARFKEELEKILQLIKPEGYLMADLKTHVGDTRIVVNEASFLANTNLRTSNMPTILHDFLKETPYFKNNFTPVDIENGIYRRSL